MLTLALLFCSAPPQWQYQHVDPKFRSEGVAVADVNKDGKLDLLTGEQWYAGPDFKTSHEMQKPGDYGDGLKNYSHSFAVWADDINKDGWADCIVIDFPGTPCYWLENPKGEKGHWKKHVIWHSACNETPLYKDLLGTGKKVLIMGFQPRENKDTDNMGQMAYFAPGSDPTAPWMMHPISEPSTKEKPIAGTMRFSHGLGVGDVNGDGRLDVMTSGTNTKGIGGWWEQPDGTADVTGSWTFHPFNFGEACADMHLVGKDIIATSAHKFGIWKLERHGEEFKKLDLFPDLVSETHAVVKVDLDGDGIDDLVTGKRWWSHGKNEPGSDKPASIVMLKGVKAADGAITFQPVTLHDNSGIGTQFEVIDLDGDGKLDIVTSNKKGVHVLRQTAK